ncbi:uncharacterized protein LOC111051191 [Nilaparvata lugens]|uniref:uncharacterized protein LOC111051191 n=1 Tax=Nilaparvata lugens TaxID=108931 RepID=UPI000B98281D|nr:uncharacterized protein LOC111051191 [Nilaparvata lugens]
MTSPSSTELFLEVIYTFPLLYDINHKDYKNVWKRDKIWEDIGKTLDAPGDELKKKWRNLRDTYVKYLKATKPTIEQAKKNYKTWTWATQMEKFKPYLGAEKTKVSDDRDESYLGHVLECELLEMDSPGPSSEPPSKRKKLVHSPTSISRNIENVAQSLENESQVNFDSTDHLMLSYSKTIKTFSRARQAGIKLKIAQLVNEAEMEQIREDEQSAQCFSSVGSWGNLQKR